MGDEPTQDTDSDNSDFVFSVSTGKKRPTVAVMINGIKGHMEADSGASANIMDKEQFHKISNACREPIQLMPANNQVFAYGQSEPMALAGKFTAPIRSLSTNIQTNAEFIVLAQKQANSKPLLSLETGIALDVIHIANRTQLTKEDELSNRVEKAYPEVFTGLGKHKSIKAKFIIDSTVEPIVQKPRKVPYNLEKQVEEEEERLLAMGILETVPDEVPTTWCTNPVVAPKKNGKIRFCSNMRAPNTAIRRPMTESLTVEDVKVKLSRAKVFSKLDMNEAYHQIELDEESRHATTFYGTTRRLRYKRLNYSAISSQDIFDKAMDDTIHGLSNVLHIRDDFVVYGENTAEHDKALESLLQRFKDTGLTLSHTKCKFRVKEIEFFGLKFSQGRVQPAPSQVEALQSMSEPKNASEVRSFLGMAQFSAQFIPNYSEISTPLRKLTRKSVQWKWEQEEKAAFDKLKTSLSIRPALGYYETGCETKLIVDAGPHGLGLVLMQKKNRGWQPVFNASRSLTEVEQRYSQLEREALAIRWGCERCYTYLIGSRFTVVTDHQPLLSLFNNPNSRPPIRLERWLMYLQQFDFKVEYCKGIENAADYLFRHSVAIDESYEHINRVYEASLSKTITSCVPRALNLKDVQEATAKDEILSELISIIIDSKPWEIKKKPHFAPYGRIFSELSVVEQVVMRGTQIVIPQALQDRVLNICHEGHLGIVKSKQLLRSKVWFPGIDKKMEARCKGCLACQATVTQKSRTPIVMTETPSEAWERVAADFCGPFPTGELVLVVIDERSRYPEIEIVNSTSAESTETALEKIFATHGNPQVLKSDNGPPFNSHAFKDLCIQKGIQHRRITPRWPEANGLVENFMKSVGKATKTAHAEGKNWKTELYRYVANYRQTPHPATGKSPREVIFGKVMRGKLPELPHHKEQDEIKDHDMKIKAKQKTAMDKKRNTKEHEVSEGDIVLIKQEKKNKLSAAYEPLPHVVDKVNGSMITARKSNGKLITRNSSAFKKIPRELTEDHTGGLENEFEIGEETVEEEVTPETVEEEITPETEKKEKEIEPKERVTRSGRVSRKPKYLQDYIRK